MDENQLPPIPPLPSPPPASSVPVVSGITAICPSCGAVVPSAYTFCPNCGKPLGGKSLSTSLRSKIWIYGLSVLLPPLGMWPGIKYFKSEDLEAKKMGMIAIILTVLSTIITLWLTFAFVQSYINQVNSVLTGTGIPAGAGIF